jgi:hypothetical protein
VRWLAAGCAEALQSIHSVGLLHRDVKPSNVLVAPTGPQVIDFGVARVAERVQLTATRGAAGTPSYMAPEQARDATLVSSASDIFSLGATLVFAATGHPPYQGETAMDILVRLATERPDLTGLPGELTDLVSACLERVPRDRPTEAAILAELGSFALPAGPGHSYLPDSAMALIAEYQRNPGHPAEATADGDDDEYDHDSISGGTDGSAFLSANDATSGSHTALPGFESPAALHAEPRRSSRPGRRRQAPRLGHRARAAPRIGPLGWAGVGIAAAALLAAGVGTGLALGEPSAQPSSNASPAIPGGTGPICTPGTPQLCLNQPFGDGDTGYGLHGDGYVPFTPITVTLVSGGVSRASRYHPVADRQGTFNYTIDEGHLFFGGPIPPGSYEVVVTAPDRSQVITSFIVYNAANEPPIRAAVANPPPSGAPPSGSGGGPPP